MIDADLARASTLPARSYTDPEIYGLEKEKIFARTWQPVGDVHTVLNPGDYLTAEIAQDPIVVVRDQSGTLRAFYNVCRHRAGAVAAGCGSRKSLQCRYHGWTYGLDGRLLHTPELDGIANFDKKDFGLVPLQVEAFGPFVFVNKDPAQPPLASQLQDVLTEMNAFGVDRLVKRAERDYVIACNWKVYVDNYLEGYHVPIAHPGLNKVLDYPKYRVITHRLHSEQVSPVKGGAISGDRALYEWVFPNWMLNIYGGQLSINVVLPLSVDKTLTRFVWYFAPEAKDDEVKQVVDFGHEIQEEDIVLCEMVQRGLSSRAYDRGRFSPVRENGVHHFQRLVEEFLAR